MLWLLKSIVLPSNGEASRQTMTDVALNATSRGRDGRASIPDQVVSSEMSHNPIRLNGASF